MNHPHREAVLMDMYTSFFPMSRIVQKQKKWVKNGKKSFLHSFCCYIKEFLEESSFHGVKYVVAPHVHPLERIFWLLTLIAAFGGAISLIVSNYQHYSANPIVVSVEKNYREWYTPFPAVTACFDGGVDDIKASAYIKDRWGEVNKSQESYYMKFINYVTIFENVEPSLSQTFSQDSSLLGVDIYDMALRVAPNVTYEDQFFQEGVRVKLTPIMTELGVCYSWGNTLKVKLRPANIVQEPLETRYCHILNSACYALIEQLKKGASVWVHSPFDVVNILPRPFRVDMETTVETGFSVLELTASPLLRYLGPSHRHCVFPEDSQISHNICRMRCRTDVVLRLCGCVPYFYRTLSNKKECSVTDMTCVMKFKEELEVHERENTCKCLPQCSDVFYTLESKQKGRWDYIGLTITSFRWGIDRYAKTRLRRDIMFTFEDLLVSLGGTAAFFLGCSLLSVVEVVYFFTLRVACRLLLARHASKR